MKYEQQKENIRNAYDLINEDPDDRLGCINGSLKILTVLNSGAIFLNEVVTSPYLEDYSMDDLKYIHESFCDSAAPLIEMLEYFAEKMEKDAKEHSFAV